MREGPAGEHAEQIREGVEEALGGLKEEMLGALEATRADSFEKEQARLSTLRGELERRESLFQPEELKRALKEIRRGGTKRAERLLQRVITDEPEYAAEATYHLGIIAEGQFDFQAAKRHYDEAVRRTPTEPKFLVACGRTAVALRLFEDGKRLLERALVLFESRADGGSAAAAEALTELAKAAYEQGRYAEAEKYTRQALEIRERVLGAQHPNTASSLHGLGADCNAQGRYAEAERYYRRALEI